MGFWWKSTALPWATELVGTSLDQAEHSYLMALVLSDGSVLNLIRPCRTFLAGCPGQSSCEFVPG